MLLLIRLMNYAGGFAVAVGTVWLLSLFGMHSLPGAVPQASYTPVTAALVLTAGGVILVTARLLMAYARIDIARNASEGEA